jgi:hypothetical protein
MSHSSLLRLYYKNAEAGESSRLDIYDESALPGLDKTIAVHSVAPIESCRKFMPLTTEQCREVAIALCPPGEIASEWKAFLADAATLLAAPEVDFKSVLGSLRCGVDMLREACAMVEATQAQAVKHA